jgi:hypothetical protein
VKAPRTPHLINWLRACVAPVVAAALALAPAAALAAAPQATKTKPKAEPVTIFKVDPTFNPEAEGVTDSSFAGVSASDPAEAWAVGTLSNEDALDRGLVEHFTGTEFTRVPIQEPSGEQVEVNAVDDISPDNAWLVGTHFPGGIGANGANGRILIEHWNGTKWSTVPSPDPATGARDQDTLNAIAGSEPDDLWAAGNALNEEKGRIELVFEHYNGKDWTLTPTPTPENGGEEEEPAQFASGITVIGPEDVWAVGTEESHITHETLAAHWNGKEWSLVPTPQIVARERAQNQLTAVSAVGPDEVFASGFADNVEGAHEFVPGVLRFNGTKWTAVKAPNKGSEGAFLRGIVALSPTNVFAVGQSETLNGDITTLAEQFNGSKWTIVKSPNPGEGKGDSLDAVSSAGATNLFAVGADEVPGQCCVRTLALQTSEG